jgi:hypothetical protein
MPPADAAPDPLDRPAAALWHEFESFCWEGANADRFGSRGGLWLPSCPWYGLPDWQRDLARRLAAAVLAADGQPGRGRATMTAEERAAAFARAWGSEGIPRGGLAVALAAAFREAEAAAAARQRAADAAALFRYADSAEQHIATAALSPLLRRWGTELRAGGGGQT